MVTFWATFEKIGYFLFHHLVTLEGRERERERERENHFAIFDFFAESGNGPPLSREARPSVTRLGDFWKFFITNFHVKVAQIFGDYLAILKTSLCE